MNTIKKFILSSLTDDDGKINKDLISLLFRPIIATLYLLMIAITFAQVIFRYLLNSALPWAGELAIFLFIWIIFLGASIALMRGVHIGVDIFTLHNKLLALFLYVFCFTGLYRSIRLLRCRLRHRILSMLAIFVRRN